MAPEVLKDVIYDTGSDLNTLQKYFHNSKVAEMAPEVIFVKPEVTFFEPEVTFLKTEVTFL